MVTFVRAHGLFLALAGALYGADQFTKWAVITYVPLHTSWPETGFLRITHIANSGSAFGLFGNRNGMLTIASFVGIAVIALVYRNQRNPGALVRASLALMLAGALGNLTDRLLHGHVTDFVDIGPWYIFNVADASIVTGVVALVLAPLFAPRAQAAPAPDTAVTPSADPTPSPVADSTATPIAEQPPAAGESQPASEGHDHLRP